MRRLVVLLGVLLAFVVAGCEEVTYPVSGGEHQLYVEDTDGYLDQHNIDTACPYGEKPVDVEWIDTDYAAIVTCPGGKD